MPKWPPNEGIFPQNFLGEDPQTPLIKQYILSQNLSIQQKPQNKMVRRLLWLKRCLLRNMRTTLTICNNVLEGFLSKNTDQEGTKQEGCQRSGISRNYLLFLPHILFIKIYQHIPAWNL